MLTISSLHEDHILFPITNIVVRIVVIGQAKLCPNLVSLASRSGHDGDRSLFHNSPSNLALYDFVKVSKVRIRCRLRVHTYHLIRQVTIGGGS